MDTKFLGYFSLFMLIFTLIINLLIYNNLPHETAYFIINAFIGTMGYGISFIYLEAYLKSKS